MQNLTTLPTLEALRSSYPNEVDELEKYTSTADLEKFYSFANDPKNGIGYNKVARYAGLRAVQAQVPSTATPISSQYHEDCVAERIWYASMSVGEIDKKTRGLIERHGFLGAMIEQLKPITKVGSGNFSELRKSGLVNCTSEYCAWKWGQKHLDSKLSIRLNSVAQQYGFQ